MDCPFPSLEEWIHSKIYRFSDWRGLDVELFVVMTFFFIMGTKELNQENENLFILAMYK
jgi:hypothetical protein